MFRPSLPKFTNKRTTPAAFAAPEPPVATDLPEPEIEPIEHQVDDDDAPILTRPLAQLPRPAAYKPPHEPPASRTAQQKPGRTRAPPPPLPLMGRAEYEAWVREREAVEGVKVPPSFAEFRRSKPNAPRPRPPGPGHIEMLRARYRYGLGPDPDPEPKPRPLAPDDIPY